MQRGPAQPSASMPVGTQASAMPHVHSPLGGSGASWGRGTPPAAMSPGPGVMSPPQMVSQTNPNHQVSLVATVTRHYQCACECACLCAYILADLS